MVGADANQEKSGIFPISSQQLTVTAYFQDFTQRSRNNKETMSAEATLLVPVYIAPLQIEK